MIKYDDDKIDGFVPYWEMDDDDDDDVYDSGYDGDWEMDDDE